MTLARRGFLAGLLSLPFFRRTPPAVLRRWHWTPGVVERAPFVGALRGGKSALLDLRNADALQAARLRAINRVLYPAMTWRDGQLVDVVHVDQRYARLRTELEILDACDRRRQRPLEALAASRGFRIDQVVYTRGTVGEIPSE